MIHNSLAVCSWALLEKLLVLQLLTDFQNVMESEGSSPCSQQPSTGPYLQPISPVHIIPSSLSLRSMLTLSSYLHLGLPCDLFLLAFQPKSYTHSSYPHLCYMLGPSHFPRLDHFTYTWRRVQVVNHNVHYSEVLLQHMSHVFVPTTSFHTLSSSIFILPFDAI
jgi:hypothetical protein